MKAVVDVKPKLLIVEDDEGWRRQYRWAFPAYDLVLADARRTALDIFTRDRPPVAIVDLGLPPDPDGASEGLAALQEILRLAPETRMIVASGNEQIEHALEAVRIGAYDFYRKPVDIDALRTLVDHAHRLYALEEENRRLLLKQQRSPIESVITGNEGMLAICRTVEKIAPTDVTVLLLGESGTGKEVLAEAVHQLSPRRNGPFIAINCGAIPDALLESELFGHERGVFTGAIKQTIGKIESAHRGTLFLDEIGDLPGALQVKLLRFLQNRVIERVGGRQQIRVDVRIVCATNQNLEDSMRGGEFREDLFYRVSEMVVNLPPLRERGGDPVQLAHYFMHIAAKEMNRKVRGFTPEAAAAIASHRWPGNIRELKNRIKRAVIMCETRLISAPDLDLEPDNNEAGSLDLRKARHQAERRVLELALGQSSGNLSAAAKLLGISRPTLYDLLATHNLSVPSDRNQPVAP